MRNFITALAAVLFLWACGPLPAPAPSPAVTAATTPTPALVAPGRGTTGSPWRWDAQGAPSTSLASALSNLKTPEDVGTYLASNFPWRDDYDATRFLAPDELIAQGYGICSAFARFWCYSLERQGYAPSFVAFWGPSSAHAVAVFRDATGHWRLCSNQNYSTTDLGTERDGAIVRSAVEFYGGAWSQIIVFDPDGGVIRQTITNTANPVPAAPPAGQRLFNITR